MNKRYLLKVSERHERLEENNEIYSYSKLTKKETARIASAIIKTICNEDDVTPLLAKEALRMAVDIINRAGEHETII